VGSDTFQMLTYSQQLGPTAAEEAANVQSQLVPIASPLTESQLTPVAVPDYSGLSFPGHIFVPATDLPELQTIVVTGERTTTTAPAPFVAPQLAFPGEIQPGRLPGIPIGTQAAAVRGTSTAYSPATAELAQVGRITGLRPRVAPPYLVPGQPIPGLGFGTGAQPGPGTEPKPEEATQPSTTDCQAVCTQQKDKQKQKKQKKTRNVCYRGVYYERKSGLLKFKRERIPCR
jgi:hypothetical protein